MARGKVLFANPQEGDIKIYPEKPNEKWIYTDGKWVYIKKPKEHFKKYQPKKKWVNNFPPVTLPDHIKPTKYPHYYVSKYGVAYREPRRCDEDGRFGEVNEWGLIELTTQLRGNSKDMNKRYDGLNIYFYDENNKNIGNKKKNIHQLVAETWVPNPHGYTEILHQDENPRNNHYTNLKWGTHKENMSVKALPDGTRRRSKGGKGSLYEKKDGEWVLVPSNKPAWNKGLKGISWNTLPEGAVTTRIVNGSLQKFIKQNGEWVYQKKGYAPDGTIRTDKDGNKRKKINGKWVYQRKDGSFSTGMTERPLPDGTIRTYGNATLKKIDGKWVYQKKEKKKKIPKVTKKRLHYRNVLPEGTIRTRSDGTIWIKENGAWVYQKKKDLT